MKKARSARCATADCPHVWYFASPLLEGFVYACMFVVDPCMFSVFAASVRCVLVGRDPGSIRP